MYATLKGQPYKKKFSLKKDLIELFFDSLRVQDVSLEQPNSHCRHKCGDNVTTKHLLSPLLMLIEKNTVY